MTTELFHTVTWYNGAEPEMRRGPWFYTREGAEQHAAKIESVMGDRVGVTIATTSECQRLGV